MKFSAVAQARFCAVLRQQCVVGKACDTVGISRQTAYHHRANNPDFAKAWDDAIEHGVDLAEAEAFRRAVEGYEEPVVYQGQITPRTAPVFDAEGRPVIDELTKAQKWAPVLDDQGRPVPLTVRKYSDALLTLILKGRRKKVYADRTELTGADGGPVTTMDEATRSARAAQLLAIAAARKAADDGSDLA